MNNIDIEQLNINLYNQCKINSDSSLEKIKYLISLGADINYKLKQYGHTPLHVACFYECKDIVIYLLENGADYKMINSNSKTALDLMIPPVGSYYADDPRLIMHNEITNFIKHNFY